MAIRALTEEYNAGFGLDAVVVVEGSNLEHPRDDRIGFQPLDPRDYGRRFRALCPHARHVDSSESTRWVALNRTDEDTAAYLVQDWRQRLSLR